MRNSPKTRDSIYSVDMNPTFGYIDGPHDVRIDPHGPVYHAANLHSVLLRCSADCNPRCHYRWEFIDNAPESSDSSQNKVPTDETRQTDDVRLKRGRKRPDVLILGDTPDLRLADVCDARSGGYRCVAYNNHGTMENRILIQQTGKSKISNGLNMV